MPLRKRKPTSAGRRFQTVSDFSEITRDEPEKSLLAPKKKSGGRNNYGRKTSRHRGGGHKQRYRIVDFKRDKDGVPAKVASIEYDPNRNARIALLHYLDGEKRYILAPARVKVGDRLQSGQGSEIRPGNALPLRYIPVGTTVHNVELKPGAGGRMGRGAGASIQLVAKEGDFATLRLPSTEMRRVPIDCRATVGEVGNPEAELASLGKEGRRAPAEQREARHQDPAATVHDQPRHGRPHQRRPRRPQPRADLRHRGHGRPQARRVRPHAHVPLPRRPAEARPPMTGHSR